MRLIEANDMRVSFTDRELSDIAFDVKRVLLDTAKNHWLYWYKENNESHSAEGFVDYIRDKEAPRVELVRMMFGLVGLSRVYEDLQYELKGIYKDGQK